MKPVRPLKQTIAKALTIGTLSAAAVLLSTGAANAAEPSGHWVEGNAPSVLGAYQNAAANCQSGSLSSWTSSYYNGDHNWYQVGGYCA
jgi:hypothetical protein